MFENLLAEGVFLCIYGFAAFFQYSVFSESGIVFFDFLGSNCQLNFRILFLRLLFQFFKKRPDQPRRRASDYGVLVKNCSRITYPLFRPYLQQSFEQRDGICNIPHESNSTVLMRTFKHPFQINIFIKYVVETFVAENLVDFGHLPLLDVRGVRERCPEKAF